MLQQKIEKNTVLTIKLISGEEIIGYFEDDDGYNINLRKPVVPVPTKEGGLGLAPYVMSVDYLNSGSGIIPFAKSSVITMVETGSQFSNAFQQQVSGLDLSNTPGNKKPGLITT